ncbi:phosphatase PAP2 family protein [Senegalia sp. (in: firmicutes)]|uniref:phosphatase PAP2 family protein n=2 Tax=Senegalia sp. (in: firmicutes) TaxID=1924098 RepID=UPI003F9A15A6
MNTNNKEIKSSIFPIILLIIGFILSGLMFLGFIEIAEEVIETEVQNFDSNIISFLNEYSSSFLDQFFKVITELGSVWFLTAGTLIVSLILFFKEKKKLDTLFLIITVAGSGVLIKALKNIFKRERPSIIPNIDAVGFSFPSGHAMGSITFYGFLIYLIIKSKFSKLIKWLLSIILALLFILIGMSRVYLGAHFPSDVIAGQLSGLFWMIITIVTLEWIKWHNKNNIRPIDNIKDIFFKRN